MQILWSAQKCLSAARELATFTSPEESVVGVRLSTAPPSSMHRPRATQSRTKTEQKTRGTVCRCATMTRFQYCCQWRTAWRIFSR